MKTYASLTAVVFLLCSATASLAAPTVIWSIGENDKSGRELGLERKIERYRGEIKPGFTYNVASDKPEKWPFIHAGPIDQWGGATTHPLTIKFDLAEVPGGQCALVVHTLGSYAHANQRLQSSINGHTTMSPVPKGPGDEILYDESKAKTSAIRVEFFPELLRKGQNEITLTIADGAWMLYDNVQLEVNEAAKPVRLADFRVEVTPCLTTATNGLAQVLRCHVNNRGPSAEVQLAAAAAADASPAKHPLKFGASMMELKVRRVDAPTTVTVELTANDEKLSQDVELLPQREWKIFAVPSIHTDIGYTHRQEEVFHRHNVNLDKVVEMCKSNPLFHWSIEVAWEVQNYFNDRPEAAQKELIALMQQGRLGLNGGYLNMLTALMSDEAMNRYVYYAAGLRRKHGIEVNTSLMTDIPTATRGLAAAMAASGIRYFAEGCNQDRGPILRHSGIDAPFWWEGPDGSRVLSWLSDAYAQSAWLAQAPDLDSIYDHVAAVVRGHERKGERYPFDAAYLYGAFLDNWEVDTRYGRFVKDWNERYAYPQIVIARGPEFFQYIEQNFEDKIETRKTDFGAYWEDGAGSTQRETTIHMENQRHITTAEVLWSLAKLNGARESYPLERFTRAWDDIILYAEHTWGAAQSISAPDDPMTIDQWKVKSEYAYRPAREIKEMYKQGLEAYVNAVPGEPGKLLVFNPSSWPRSGAVPVPEGIGRDPRNAKVQRLERKVGETESTGTLYRDFVWVDDVPPLGSKILDAAIDQPATTLAGSEVKLNVLENQYYRIELSTTQGVSSIVDKDTGAELLDRASPYSFAQLVYASGGEGTRMIHPDRGPFAKFFPNRDHRNALNPPKESVLVTPANVTFVQSEPTGGPLFTEAVFRSSAPGMQYVATYVRLHHREKRISVDVHLHNKQEIRKKEAVYIAFPFAGGSPKFRLGMTNAIQRPDRDFSRGACYEWFCIQDFVAVADEKSDTEVVWTSPDVPLVCLSEINRGRWIVEPELTTATIFSYAMNNYWHTNYKAGQGGNFHFRYDITSGKGGISNEECLRFARETAIPMVLAASGSKAGQPIVPKVSGEGVIVGTIKGAEDGKGVVMRLRNALDQPTTANVVLDAVAAEQPLNAQVLNLVEDETSSVPDSMNGNYSIPLKAQQVVTVKLSTESPIFRVQSAP